MIPDDLTSPSLTVVVSFRSDETAFVTTTGVSSFTAFVAATFVCTGIELFSVKSSKNPNVTAAVADEEPFRLLSVTLVTLSSHMITAGSCCEGRAESSERFRIFVFIIDLNVVSGMLLCFRIKCRSSDETVDSASASDVEDGGDDWGGSE